MGLDFHDVELPRDRFTLSLSLRLDAPVTGVFGPSGAGKTSLLHLVAGLERPARGSIAFNGRTLADAACGVFAPPWRRRIGVVFQDARLFPHLSVRKNLLYGRSSAAAAGPSFEEVVGLLDLDKLLDSWPGKISGGEAQRVALGRALLASPELLLLDEPFSAVDATLRQQILPFLWKVRSRLNVPMLVVSHDLPDILRLTDQLLLLDHGKMVGHGPVDSLALDRQAFGVLKTSGVVNVFDLEVEGFEDEDTVALTNGAGLRLYAAFVPGLAKGRHVRASFAPEDVVLSRGEPGESSARNVLPGRVAATLENSAQSLCQVDLGGAKLLAEVTRSSFHRLGLKPGDAVFCLFKANRVSLFAL